MANWGIVRENTLLLLDGKYQVGKSVRIFPLPLVSVDMHLMRLLELGSIIMISDPFGVSDDDAINVYDEVYFDKDEYTREKGLGSLYNWLSGFFPYGWNTKKFDEVIPSGQAPSRQNSKNDYFIKQFELKK